MLPHDQVSDEKKLAKTDADDIHATFFSDANKATDFVQMVDFQPFADTADAVAAATACIEGEVTKSLKNFLKKQIKKDSVAVADKGLGVALKEAISGDGKSTRLNSSHRNTSRMPSSA